MARILLANFDEQAGVRLSAFLRIEHHETRLASESQSFPQMLRQYGAVMDLVIVDVSCRERYARSLVAAIASYRAKFGPRPMILCVSRVYRGPQFELELESKGARVVYV